MSTKKTTPFLSWQALFVSKSAYSQIASEFHPYHKHDLNVVLHLFTTSIGVWGVLQWLLLMHDGLENIVYLYAALVFLTTPITTGILHTLLVFGMILAVPAENVATMLSLPTSAVCLAAILAGYGLQDVSHWLFDEKTYMSSYMGSKNPYSMLFLHSFWLLALVIDSILMRKCFVFDLFVSKNRTVRCVVSNRRSVESLRTWIHANVAPTNETTHVWPHVDQETSKQVSKLEDDSSIYAAFRQVFDKTHYDVEPVQDMNEIYVTAVGSQRKMNSDAVFYTPHTDGPYWWLPGCSLYRVLIGITPNRMVRTRFNLQHSGQNDTVVDMHDVLGFDYNRELHWIDHVPNESNTERRSLLKLHYIVYPKGWERYGRLAASLNTSYNTWARGNFLKTLRPSSAGDAALAWWIWLTTWCNALLEEYVGWNNVLWIGGAYASCGDTSSLAFTILTSFHHYMIYICTLAYASSSTNKQQQPSNNNDVAHGYLMRNAKLYKTLAFMQLAKRTVPLVELPRDAPALCAMAAGFGITLLATAQLGFLRTYFGSELKLCQPCWMNGFPYNVIPHPMIVGQLLAFGTMLVWWRRSMSTETMALIATHMGFYVIHMVQEIFTSSY